MREIKFRVAVKSPHWDDYAADKWLISTNSFTIGDFWEHEVELEFADGGTLPFGDIDWLTDEVKYLQYTGLKAKGVEIYEGDILADALEPKTARLLVAYQAPSFIKLWPEGQTTAMIDMEEWEVIGNLYESAELLEAK